MADSSNVCPKCGSPVSKTETGIDGLPVHYWRCGSNDDGNFFQWSDCRILELENQLSALQAEYDSIKQFSRAIVLKLKRDLRGQHLIEEALTDIALDESIVPDLEQQLATLAAENERLKACVHDCPDCGESCKGCRCYEQKMEALTAERDKLREANQLLLLEIDWAEHL